MTETGVDGQFLNFRQSSHSITCTMHVQQIFKGCSDGNQIVEYP